jgi:hypothetical protein
MSLLHRRLRRRVRVGVGYRGHRAVRTGGDVLTDKVVWTAQ